MSSRSRNSSNKPMSIIIVVVIFLVGLFCALCVQFHSRATALNHNNYNNNKNIRRITIYLHIYINNNSMCDYDYLIRFKFDGYSCVFNAFLQTNQCMRCLCVYCTILVAMPLRLAKYPQVQSSLVLI